MFLSIVNDNENDDHEVNALKFKVEIYKFQTLLCLLF